MNISVDKVGLEKMGKYLMRGALTELCYWFAALLAISMIITCLQHDSTDAPGFWHHSGLTIYRDARTGVEYLGTKDGGLIPRYNTSILLPNP